MSEWIKSKGLSDVEMDVEKDKADCLASLQFKQLKGTNLVILFKLLMEIK